MPKPKTGYRRVRERDGRLSIRKTVIQPGQFPAVVTSFALCTGADEEDVQKKADRLREQLDSALRQPVLEVEDQMERVPDA